MRLSKVMSGISDLVTRDPAAFLRCFPKENQAYTNFDCALPFGVYSIASWNDFPFEFIYSATNGDYNETYVLSVRCVRRRTQGGRAPLIIDLYPEMVMSISTNDLSPKNFKPRIAE
ncbi:MAG TPA: hypothetical protein VMF06_20935 [Candidatus Limnocylindria bacterium]|jgi:hypothetical protein|nr:hypothetical protein [Candidatus Limnocylindria bacterium]